MTRPRIFKSAAMQVVFSLSALASCAPPGPSLDDQPAELERQSQAFTTTNLPGGTSLEVHIASPAHGSTVPAGSLTVSGTAAVGQATPVADTGVLYVMDVSGSTRDPGRPGCGGDPNLDGHANSVLDCEIAALFAVNQAVLSAGTVAQVGAVVFASEAAAADVGPDSGQQLLTNPYFDDDGNGVPDIKDVIASAFTHTTDPFDAGVVKFTGHSFAFQTNFAAAIDAAGPVLAAMTSPKKIVLFLSDGEDPNPPAALTTALATIAPGVIFHSFAIGAGSSCADKLLTIAGHGTSGQGTCTHVSDAAALPNIIPAAINARLTNLTLSVDGGPAQTMDSVTPGLPQEAVSGSVSVAFSKALAGLTPGSHQLCATATGSDGGGAGTVTDCVSVLINAPPVAACHSLIVPAGPLCTAAGSVDNGSSDPDGDPITCSQAPSGPYPLGSSAVTLTCSDPHGASGSCSAVVKVVDVTPPAFTYVPGARTISQCRQPSIGQATASDSCGAVTVTSNAPLVFPLGATTVTWTAVDAAGNATSATQLVTAQLGDDPSCCPAGTRIILGSNGDDTLVGTSGRDCILLRGGRDTCNAFAGDDLVSGGDGDDVIDSGDGNDLVMAGPGRDTVMTGNGNDRLDGGPGTDTCNAGGGSNTVTACEIVP